MSYGPAPWQQAHWDWRAAGNFIFGGAGAGLLVATPYAGAQGLANTLLVLAGMGLIGLGLLCVWLEIGRPLRAMNVMRRAGRSGGAGARGARRGPRLRRREEQRLRGQASRGRRVSGGPPDGPGITWTTPGRASSERPRLPQPSWVSLNSVPVQASLSRTRKKVMAARCAEASAFKMTHSAVLAEPDMAKLDMARLDMDLPAEPISRTSRALPGHGTWMPGSSRP